VPDDPPEGLDAPEELAEPDESGAPDCEFECWFPDVVGLVARGTGSTGAVLRGGSEPAGPRIRPDRSAAVPAG
jgi:hypothetical protein